MDEASSSLELAPADLGDEGEVHDEDGMLTLPFPPGHERVYGPGGVVSPLPYPA